MTQTLWNIPFFNGTASQAVDQIISLTQKSTPVQIATPNPEQIMLASRDDAFKSILHSFDLFLPDGIGIIWASKKMGKPLSGRITGVEIVEKLLAKAKEQGWQSLIIGGKSYSQKSLTTLDVDWIPGYDDVTDSIQVKQQDTDVLKQIQERRPEIIFVALGAPHQEQWVHRHSEFLKKIGVKIVMVVGGSFDFLTHRVKRAPRWVQDAGLEWAYRLYQEPWRWRRQLQLIPFVWKVFMNR